MEHRYFSFDGARIDLRFHATFQGTDFGIFGLDQGKGVRGCGWVRTHSGLQDQGCEEDQDADGLQA
jgi:hypothetical protein